MNAGKARSAGRFSKANMQLWSLFFLVILWVARNTIFIRRRTGIYYDQVDTTAMFQMLIVGAILMLLISGPGLVLLRRIKTGSTKFYFLYVILGMTSAIWSANPMFSFYRAVEVAALSMAVLVFCTSGANVDENLKRTRLVVWCAVLLIAVGNMRSGFSWNLRDNTLGAAATMTAVFFAAWMLGGRVKPDRNNLIQGGIGVAIVLLSLSLASWWSFWFGVFYCAVFSRRKSVILGLMVAGALIFFLLGTDTRENLLVRDKGVHDIQNLSGRKLLWTDYWAASKRQPVLGFGFSVGAREVGSVYTTNTHNIFFGALMGLGWVGVSCWLLFFAALARELITYRHSRYPVWLGCAAALAAGTLNSMSIGILGEQWSPATTVFMAFLGFHMSFVQTVKQARQRQIIRPTKIRVSRRLPRDLESGF